MSMATIISNEEKLAVWFAYHAPTDDQVRSYVEIRDKARELAEVILKNTPASADQTVALRKVREAVMVANAAIACDGV